jgi:primary-amine oxidase
MKYRQFFFVCFSILVLSALFLFSASRCAAEATHPLDPLDGGEIASAVKILQAAPEFPKIALFSTVQLNEPPKDEVLNFKAGAGFRREAFAIVLDREKIELTKRSLICEQTKSFRGKRSRACSRSFSSANTRLYSKSSNGTRAGRRRCENAASRILTK